MPKNDKSKQSVYVKFRLPTNLHARVRIYQQQSRIAGKPIATIGEAIAILVARGLDLIHLPPSTP